VNCYRDDDDDVNQTFRIPKHPESAGSHTTSFEAFR